MEMLDNGMIRILDGMMQDGERFHQTIQNDAQFKTYEIFISGIFHLIVLNHN